MVFKDYYAILGCDISSTDNEIREKYYNLARKYHPDKTSGNKKLEEKFKNINEAYNVLSNKNKRAKYNKIYYNEKDKSSVIKRESSYLTKSNKTSDNMSKLEMILCILFVGFGFMLMLFEFVNNNLMFYKYFYNTDLEFKKKCFINLLSTVIYIYTVVISCTPTYVLIFNSIRQMLSLKAIQVKENIETAITAIITIVMFFLSIYDKIRFYITIIVCIIGNIYIIKAKIWKKSYCIISLILMYILFVPETFLAKSKREFGICDGRIWCSGETLHRYYKNTKKKL